MSGFIQLSIKCAFENFVDNPQIIAKLIKPSIRPEQARKSLHLLKSLGLIVYSEDKQRYVPTKTRISTGDEISSIAVIRYHQKMIDLAKESITSSHEFLRDVSSISIAIPKTMIPNLKEEVSIFSQEDSCII